MLGRGALAHARNYSWERTASGLYAVYADAMWHNRTRHMISVGAAA
jgi:D-inositol-3-phosphate glycosyltransferase